ncbi:MAG: hypothetical protein GC191_00980 [Azospirillum sp.]|nr:hypothetical protein [Azospirillum sp.]
MTAPLTLTTVSPAANAFVDQIQRTVARGANTVHISPRNSLADAVVEQLTASGLPCRLNVEGHPEAVPAQTDGGGADGPPDVFVRLETDGDQLALSLMDLLDLPRGHVLVPRTARYGLGLPLFLISIPKSGTHLLIELARALGYRDGGCHDGDVGPGAWHYVEYSNSHTAARDFFVDTVRRSPFGNRHHPFSSSPALFIYRHPYDILVSEAEYYHRSGNTAFSGYLSHQTYEQRLERLADDPWLLGSLRDRIGKFAAWLDFGNVVPLSFEELIGSAGGGDPGTQRRSLWSVLLKLQVDGNVDALAGRIFSPNSATFNHGAIGRHRQKLTPRARDVLARLNDDYLRVFGYQSGFEGALTSTRIAEFRRRPLLLGQSTATSTAILVEQNFLGWNLVRLHGRYYAFSTVDGPRDLTMASAETLSSQPAAGSLAELRTRIVEMVCRDQVEKAVSIAIRGQALAPTRDTARGDAVVHAVAGFRAAEGLPDRV